MVSKLQNRIHDRKGQENKIYTIVKDRETFYNHHHHTIPNTSCSEVKYVQKEAILWNQKNNLHRRAESVECASFKVPE